MVREQKVTEPKRKDYKIRRKIKVRLVCTALAGAVLLGGGMGFAAGNSGHAAADSQGKGFLGIGVSALTAFTDLPTSHWAYPGVTGLVKEGIVSGYPDGSFRPNQKVTYGEFLKMAVTAAGKGALAEDDAQAKDKAKDGADAVDKGAHWAEPYYKEGIRRDWFGEEDIRMALLDSPIPRGHMALIVYGALGQETDSLDWDEGCSAILHSITDVDGKSPYEYAVAGAYGAGILSGYPDGSFRPEGTLSRAESAAAVGRLIEPSLRIAPDLEQLKKEYRLWKGQAAGEMAAPPQSPKGENLVEALAALYEEEVWKIYRDDPEDPLAYYVEFKAGDSYRLDKEGAAELVYRYPYSYDDRFEVNFGRGILTVPDIEKQRERVQKALEYLAPQEAADIYAVFLDTTDKAFQEKEHYMRKEYFGERPVMMDIGGGCLSLTLWPAGAKEESRSWNALPGEIKEEYYYE